jgi:hypothetical protein
LFEWFECRKEKGKKKRKGKEPAQSTQTSLLSLTRGPLLPSPSFPCPNPPRGPAPLPLSSPPRGPRTAQQPAQRPAAPPLPFLSMMRGPRLSAPFFHPRASSSSFFPFPLPCFPTHRPAARRWQWTRPAALLGPFPELELDSSPT